MTPGYQKTLTHTSCFDHPTHSIWPPCCSLFCFVVSYAQRTRTKGRKEVDTGMSLLLPRPQEGNALDKLSHKSSEGG